MANNLSFTVVYTTVFFDLGEKYNSQSSKQIIEDNIKRVLEGSRKKGEETFPNLPQKLKDNSDFTNDVIFFKVKIIEHNFSDRLIFCFLKRLGIIIPVIIANKLSSFGYNIDRNSDTLNTVFSAYIKGINELLEKKEKKQELEYSIIKLNVPQVKFGNFNYPPNK